MYFDSHVHSAASPDSKMPPEEAIAAVKKMGLGIAFTEHVDYADHIEKDPDATDAPRVIGDFVCDFNVYPKEYEKFRGEGVMLGLEYGLTQAFLKINKKIAASYDYDFILGAVHGVNGVDIYGASHEKYSTEPFAESFLSGDEKSIRQCLREYLSYTKEMIELYGFFDSFAHVDYVARYLPKVSENFVYENFIQEFDALLKILAEREIALEINTNRFGHESKFAEMEMLKICRQFKALGGWLCTLGSDAHKAHKVGYFIGSAKEIAEASGLIPVYFKERKPIRCG